LENFATLRIAHLRQDGAIRLPLGLKDFDGAIASILEAQRHHLADFGGRWWCWWCAGLR
jgi:hypothetical protein